MSAAPPRNPRTPTVHSCSADIQGPMDGEPIDVSIVIPVYGSRDILPRLVAALETALDHPVIGRHEVILVNDCSPDGAWSVLTQLAISRPWLRGVDLSRNSGQHNAVMAGLKHARGRYVVTLDDDLQHDPADIVRVVSALKAGNDLCYVHFEARRHAAWKLAGSWFNGKVAQFLIGKPKGLYLSPFRGIRRHVVDSAIRYDGPFVYVDGLLLQATRSIATISAAHHARSTGKSGYSLGKSISLWLKMATSFSATPLRIVSLVGMVGALLSLALAGVVVVIKLRDPGLPVGWPSLAVAILMMGSLQLIALGMIGEYIARVLITINRKPQFVVRRTVNVHEPSPHEEADAG